MDNDNNTPDFKSSQKTDAKTPDKANYDNPFYFIADGNESVLGDPIEEQKAADEKAKNQASEQSTPEELNVAKWVDSQGGTTK